MSVSSTLALRGGRDRRVRCSAAEPDPGGNGHFARRDLFPSTYLIPLQNRDHPQAEKRTPQGGVLSPPPHPTAKPHLLGEVELGEANEVLYENGKAFSILQEGVPENQARAA